MSLTARLEMERRGKLHFKKYQYLIPIYALALYMVEHTDYFSYWAIPSLLQMTINKVLLLEINAGERVGGGGGREGLVITETTEGCPGESYKIEACPGFY